MRTLATTCGVLALATSAAQAQNSLLFCMDSDHETLDNGGGLPAAGTLVEDEVGMVTPIAGVPYSAQTFLSLDAQYTYMGDADGDGTYVDSSTTPLGGPLDAVFVKRHIGAPVGLVTPRDVYTSHESDNDLPATFDDGDVFRFAGKGVLDVFVTEQQLDDAIGGGSTLFELDAICQDPDGNLYVSFAGTETVGVADDSVEDGGIVFIPVDTGAGGITYDLVTGNVVSITFDSARELADEADMEAMMAASGMATSVGGAPTTSSELSGLDLDPAGGTWTSPIDGIEYPNLFFCWGGFSNDGAVLSTAGGGTIATLNGVPLASTTATVGTQIGMLPEGTGLQGLNGLAVIGAQTHEFVCEAYPNRVITGSSSLFTYPQASGATPLGTVVFFWDVGDNAVGGSISCIDLGPLGQWFGLMVPGVTPAVFSIATADADGYAGEPTFFPATLVGTGLPAVVQGVDLTTFRFSTPATVDFL